MKTTQLKVRRVGVIGLAAVTGVTLMAVHPAPGDGPADGSARQSRQAGIRAYIDPQTGELGVPPPGTTTPPSVRAAGRRLTNIVEVPSTGSAGGVMINTKGRMAANVVATTDPNGKATVQCRQGGGNSE
jgi:hypothetical protein